MESTSSRHLCGHHTSTCAITYDAVFNTFVPLDYRAGVIGNRTTASHFVQAIALARILIVERLDEQAGIVVSPTVAGVVHAAAVKLLWPTLAVELGNLTQHKKMRNDTHHHVGDGRAAGGLEHRL